MTEVQEVEWLSFQQVLRIHDDSLERHGGSHGIRDRGLLESGLARPVNAFAYGQCDLFTLAALYAEGVMRNHPFVDGNKRTAHNTAAIFLLLAGYRLQVAKDTQQRVTFFEQVAAGAISTEELAQFYRDHTLRRSDG